MFVIPFETEKSEYDNIKKVMDSDLIIAKSKKVQLTVFGGSEYLTQTGL